MTKPTVLITGTLYSTSAFTWLGIAGQVGRALAAVITKSGQYRVIGADLVKPMGAVIAADKCHIGWNVAGKQDAQELVSRYKPDWVIHLAAFLSGAAENPKSFDKAIQLNMLSVNNFLLLARKYHFGLFCPSSIAAFGQGTPKIAPDDTVMRPEYLYGITKVYDELIGEYFHKRHRVDFRCLRLPGVIAPVSSTSQGTTDYAVDMLRAFALQQAEYKCYLEPHTRLPMIHIDDCVRGIFKFISTPRSSLTRSVYNIHSFSLTPAMLEQAATQITGHTIKVSHEPDIRQGIADSWPDDLDDSTARRDWGWHPQLDLRATISAVLAASMCTKKGSV